jgi:hypothetical protein
MPAAVDRALAELARRQHGVFSRAQALAAGLAPRTWSARLRAGRYIAMFPGVVREAAVADSWEARAMAAQLAVGGEAALARGSAGRVLELDVPPGARHGLHLLVRNRTFPVLEDLTVHRTDRLPDSDIRSVGALRTTTVPRTIVDLAGDVGPTALRRTVADAVRRDLVNATELRATAERLGRVRGKRQLLELVDELSPLDRDCRSALETAFLRLMRRAGRPPTAMNHPVVDATGRRRVLDAVYLPEKVPIELDSRLAHGTLLDWHDDLRRENAVVLTGWQAFLRFSWDDVTRRGAEVVACVRTSLSAAPLE